MVNDNTSLFTSELCILHANHSISISFHGNTHLDLLKLLFCEQIKDDDVNKPIGFWTNGMCSHSVKYSDPYSLQRRNYRAWLWCRAWLEQGKNITYILADALTQSSILVPYRNQNHNPGSASAMLYQLSHMGPLT